MSSKLKAKPRKQRLPLAQPNQAAQAFGRAMIAEWRNNGEIIQEDDIYSIDFMEDCYRKGKEDAKLNSHFGTDNHHIYYQIQKVLVKIITIVMNYEDSEVEV